MKNITVSVDEAVYHRARVHAAEEKTSVSAMVGRYLKEIASRKTAFERLKQLEDATVTELRSHRFSAEDRLKRGALHERDALH